jgi:hypothetical protein
MRAGEPNCARHQSALQRVPCPLPGQGNGRGSGHGIEPGIDRRAPPERARFSTARFFSLSFAATARKPPRAEEGNQSAELHIPLAGAQPAAVEKGKGQPNKSTVWITP